MTRFEESEAYNSKRKFVGLGGKPKPSSFGMQYCIECGKNHHVSDRCPTAEKGQIIKHLVANPDLLDELIARILQDEIDEQ